MSKQKNTGPSERELLLSRIKNLVIGSAILPLPCFWESWSTSISSPFQPC